MERKERLEKILNKNIGNPNHDKEGKFTFAPYKKYPGLQQSVKKLITIKNAEKGLTEKYLKAVDEEREKLFKKYNQDKETEDDELSRWNDGWYMWGEKDKANFSDIDIALSKAIFKESKPDIDVYRTQVDSKNPGKMSKAEYASWSPDLEYVCKWARFLAGYDSKIDIFKNKPTLENIKIIPDVLYSQRFLRNKAKYQEYILENKSSIEAFEHGLSRHDVYEKYINSIDLISKDSVPFDFYIKYNGGPGSGNFNPGQGRGVGKPSAGSKKISYEEFVEKWKKSTRSEKRELEEEYPDYESRHWDELMGSYKKRREEERKQKELEEKFNTYEKDNSHPHFDLDKVPTELKYALDVTPTQGLKKYDPKTQTLIDLKNRKEYYNEEKGIWVRVISMSPRDYSNTIIENNNGHYTSMKEIEDRTSRGGIDMYVKKFKSKERQEVPYIKFNKEGKFSGEQEGFHRSFAADEIGDKEIPVLIVTDYYGKQPFLNHGRDITKDVENYYASKTKKNSLTRNQRLDLIMNGGPGSGNFNPGQGRGVGKPSNGSSDFDSLSDAEKFNKIREEAKWTKEEVEDCSGYFGHMGYTDIQAYLRGEDPSRFTDEECKKTINGLTKKINNTKLKHDIVVYRGITIRKDRAENAMNNLFQSTGFQSTSLSESRAASAAEWNRVAQEQKYGGNYVSIVLKINLKKGQNALASYTDGEQEIILPTDSKFRAINKDNIEEGKINTIEVDYER